MGTLTRSVFPSLKNLVTQELIPDSETFRLFAIPLLFIPISNMPIAQYLMLVGGVDVQRVMLKQIAFTLVGWMPGSIEYTV